ncbi:SsgA family sporulation/cell division regulator [Streptomyces sp. NPDC058067]|uniref:SsgA family sporulation/cell division regulator n=1 Tax=Streptomyces antnestii TaxID=2494256 RepID=A0A3S2VUC1_9ACTN|nr:SsgA family sporulation/cell division regulator [Streptomyces sp. San01]RVU21282.1 SsgA family sporulation/cell division regulator [Streptomyces sp. San01]
MSAVWQKARARIVTDSPGEPPAVPAVLSYDGRVHLTVPEEGDWSFTRELLEEGLRAPTEVGDIRIWPCGRVQAVLEFHSPKGVAVVQFDKKTLVRFLRRTYSAATPVAH